MSDDPSHEEIQKKPGRDQGNPTLFFVMLGLIVFLLLVFLFVRPRGTDASPSQQQTTGAH